MATSHPAEGDALVRQSRELASDILDDAVGDSLFTDAARCLKAAADRLEALSAENARLKELLRPFADYAEHMPGRGMGHGEIGEYYHGGLRVSISTDALEAACAALQPKGDDGER